MLGLMSALCRRDRAAGGAALDTLGAGHRRVRHAAHQLQAAQLHQRPAAAGAGQLQALATAAARRPARPAMPAAGGPASRPGHDDSLPRDGRSRDQALQANDRKPAVAAASCSRFQTMQGITREAAYGAARLAAARRPVGRVPPARRLQGWTAWPTKHPRPWPAAGHHAGLQPGRFEQRSCPPASRRETAALQRPSSPADGAAAQLDGVGARLKPAVQGVSASWSRARLAHEHAPAPATAWRRRRSAAGRVQHRRFDSSSAEAGTRTGGLARRNWPEWPTPGSSPGAAARRQRSEALVERLAEPLQRGLAGRHGCAGPGAAGADLPARSKHTATRIAPRPRPTPAAPSARSAAWCRPRLEAPRRRTPRWWRSCASKLSDSLVRDNARRLEDTTPAADDGHAEHPAGRGAAHVHRSRPARPSTRWCCPPPPGVEQPTGARFTDKVDAWQPPAMHGRASRSLDALSTGSAVDHVASLGEPSRRGGAVQPEQRPADGPPLQRPWTKRWANRSMRSDEQLAYYVAQAREVIDLSLNSSARATPSSSARPAGHRGGIGQVARAAATSELA